MPNLTARIASVNAIALMIAVAGGCGTSSQEQLDEYLQYAREARQQEQLDRARTYAELAIEQGRQSSEAREILASVARQHAENHRDEGEYRRAMEMFVEAADYEPVRRRRAEDLRNGFDVAKQTELPRRRVIELGLRALEADPENRELHTELAHLAEEIGDHELAAEHYFWLSTANPRDRRVGLRLGIAYLESGDVDRAIPVLERFHRDHPDDAQIALNLADAYTTVERPDDARTVYETLLDQFPDHPMVLRRYAAFERQQGNSDRARQLMERAAEQSPGIEQREMRPLR